MWLQKKLQQNLKGIEINPTFYKDHKRQLNTQLPAQQKTIYGIHRLLLHPVQIQGLNCNRYSSKYERTWQAVRDATC